MNAAIWANFEKSAMCEIEHQWLVPATKQSCDVYQLKNTFNVKLRWQKCSGGHRWLNYYRYIYLRALFLRRVHKIIVCILEYGVHNAHRHLTISTAFRVLSAIYGPCSVWIAWQRSPPMKGELWWRGANSFLNLTTINDGAVDNTYRYLWVCTVHQ
jgi:hypothetical protein